MAAKFVAAAQLSRHFSISAVTRGKLTKPPVALFGLEGRYATALYSAAVKQNQLDVVHKEVTDITAAVKQNTRVSEYLQSPIVNKHDKLAFLSDVLGKRKCSPITLNFFSALAENGRLKRINQVVKAFQTLMNAEKGEILAEVTTAKPLDVVQLKELESALQSFLEKGNKLKLETKVDPTIIGGMQVSIGDKFVDMSIASKVKRYEKEIQDAVLS